MSLRARDKTAASVAQILIADGRTLATSAVAALLEPWCTAIHLKPCYRMHLSKSGPPAGYPKGAAISSNEAQAGSSEVFPERIPNKPKSQQAPRPPNLLHKQRALGWILPPPQ